MDKTSIPIDTDLDGRPDGDLMNTQPWMDTNDDNDWCPDNIEHALKTDPLDKNSIPQLDKAPAKKSDINVNINILMN